jgi:hydrogenase nickel incorporation protein HypB
MTQIPLERKVLNENDRVAGELRSRFAAHGILCLNLVSSPGAGKTSLLERTLEAFAPTQRVAVLTGDIQTDNDAVRLARFGFPTRQITTGGTCHLDARMIEKAIGEWNLADLDVLLIENVGNLVCPSSYDLGEAAKIVVLSVTEGEDKPLKYPAMFFRSEDRFAALRAFQYGEGSRERSEGSSRYGNYRGLLLDERRTAQMAELAREQDCVVRKSCGG